MKESLWHHMPTEEVFQTLRTDKQGLTEEEANRRLSEFGYNELKERKKVTALQIFIGQFKDIFVIMLLVAILISGLTGQVTDAITISAPHARNPSKQKDTTLDVKSIMCDVYFHI